MACAAAAAPRSEPAAAPRPASPAVQEVLDTPVGTAPADAMHWPQALDALRRPHEATALRQALLLRWLASLQTTGNFAPANETLGQAIASVGTPDSTARMHEARAWWNALLAKQLRVDLPAAEVPLPDEIDSLRNRLVTLRPGIWALRDSAHASAPVPGVAPLPGMFAWVTLHNTGDRALALKTFTLQLLSEDAAAKPTWVLACEPPRHQPPGPVQPGKERSYLCRAPTPPPALGDGGAALDTARQQGRLRIESDALDSEAGRSAIANGLAERQQEALRSFLAANASCDRRGTCAANARKPNPSTGAAAATDSTRRRGNPQPWKTWGTILAGAAVYFLLARYIALWFASLALFLALAVPAVSVFQAARTMKTADNWGGFVVLPLMAGAVILPIAVPAAAAWIYRVTSDREDLVRVLKTIGNIVIVLLIGLVFDRIADLLF